jgi:vacuolar-type H+-ATPase subunit I/STV1
MKSSEVMKDGARPSGVASLAALRLRLARVEAELARRDREAEAEASGDVYPAVLTLGAKLKGVHERLVNLQKQSGDIMESLGRRVDHVEAELRGGDSSERLRRMEQQLESIDHRAKQVDALESAMRNLEQKSEQVQNDAQERLAALMAAVTRLQNLSTEQNLRSDEIRRWFEPLKSLPNATTDIRQMGAVRERLEKMEKIFGLAGGPESEAVRQQLEACGGWQGALAAIAKFRELQDDLRQMRDERLQEQVVVLGDQIAGLRHLADPHGGWEFILSVVSRLKEQVEALRKDCDEALRRAEVTDKGLHDMVHLADPHGGWLHSLEALARAKEIHPFLEELRAIDIARRVAALPYQMEDLARKSQQVSDRLKEIEEGLEKMLHWADPHGGWEHTLQTTARFKENLEFLGKLHTIDFNALGDFFNTLKRENLVLRMKRLERMLRDLEKTYRVQEMLDKFKSEQRLLLE